MSALVLLSAPAANAYWELQPQLHAGITYEDNPHYVSDDDKAAAEARDPGITDDLLGTYVDARITGLYQTPGNKFSLTPGIRKTDYLKGDDLNTDNWYVNLSADHTDSRGAVGLNASYREDSLRNSAFENPIPDNPDSPPPTNGGSGRFSTDTQQVWELKPNLTYILSPRNLASLSATVAYTTYDQQLQSIVSGGGYFDYRYSSAELAVQHSLNAKNAFVLSLNGGTFTSEGTGGVLQNSTDSFGINAGYEHTFTGTLKGSATAGVSRSSGNFSGVPFGFDPLTGSPCSLASTCSIRNEDRNFVGDASLTKRSELTSLNFSVGRSIAPTSNGTEVIQDQFRLYVDRTLTGKLSGSIGTIYSKESSLFNAQTDIGSIIQRRQDRTYFTIGTSLSWKLTPTLSASGSYTYISNENSEIGGSNHQTNNRLDLGVVFQPVGLRP